MWKQDSPTHLQIDQSSGPLRYLFGLPLLLGGVYFLYKYLILGIVEYIQVGDWSGLFGGFLGWLVILLLGLALLIPGWVIISLRRSVVIDTSLGDLTEMQDFLIYKRVKHHRLDAFEQVMVRTDRAKKSRKSLYSVDLIRPDRSYVMVAALEDVKSTRELGNKLRTMLDLKQQRTSEPDPDEELEAAES
ncbi:MAG: hypothetical protein HS126_38075 [Anaerolineales bacterium]|nr:hypothetical protein [Anaerolineales bacterium]